MECCNSGLSYPIMHTDISISIIYYGGRKVLCSNKRLVLLCVTEQLQHNSIILFQCLFCLESWKQRQIQIYVSFKIVIGSEWQSQPERDICFHIQCTCSFNVFLQNGRQIKNYPSVGKFDCQGKRFAYILSSLFPLTEEQRLNTILFLFAFCSMVLCMFFSFL